MGYWLEDSKGNWLGDFATNKGIMDLHEVDTPALKEFLEYGVAGPALVEKLIKQLDGHKTLGYIPEMLKSANPPVFITDGCGSNSTEVADEE